MASRRSVLITGANAGLGLEIVKALCGSSQPYTIIVAARSLDKANSAINEMSKSHPDTPSKLTPLVLDIESDESIAEAATYIKTQHAGSLDVLINNAGGSFEKGIFSDGRDSSGDTLTPRQALNKTYDVNVTGTQLLTQALVPFLLKSSQSRLIFMTSGTCSLTETESEERYFNKAPPAGWPKAGGSMIAYRSSKTALNMVMRDWDRILRNDGVLVWAISPGFLATGLGGVGPEKLREMGAMDPAIGGQFVKDVVEGKRDGDAGKAIRNGTIQQW